MLKLPTLEKSTKLSTAVAFMTIALMTTGLIVLMAALPTTDAIAKHNQSNSESNSRQNPQSLLARFLSLPSVSAQALESSDVWRRVYEMMPDLPMENQYVNQETGKVSQNNTLASRLIRYHIYTKGRPPNYRLDWKLTLADYLGVNERISEATYPGADALRTNPLEGDTAVINHLTRAQRDKLVQILVSIFSKTNANESGQNPAAPPSTNSASPTSPSANSSPRSTPPNSSTDTSPFPREPKPGDARLLLPQ